MRSASTCNSHRFALKPTIPTALAINSRVGSVGWGVVVGALVRGEQSRPIVRSAEYVSNRRKLFCEFTLRWVVQSSECLTFAKIGIKISVLVSIAECVLGVGYLGE